MDQHLWPYPGIAMKRSIDLSPEQRAALLDRYRKDHDPEVRFRSHLLLLLDDGHSSVTVAALLFCSSRTIDRWVKRFHDEGVKGVTGHKPGRPFRLDASWVAIIVEWVTKHTPRDFGFLRSRWCCEAVALLMLKVHHVEVSREAVHRKPGGGRVTMADRPQPTGEVAEQDMLKVLEDARTQDRHCSPDGAFYRQVGMAEEDLPSPEELQSLFAEIRADEHAARVRDFGEADAVTYDPRMVEAYAVQADALGPEPPTGPPITPEELDEIERQLLGPPFFERLAEAAARMPENTDEKDKGEER